MTAEDILSASRSFAKARVAVIGAGLAGLSCAEYLRAAGLGVMVFEKSRGLGGRLATRRAGQLAFDHGAQYVIARSTAFLDLLKANKDSLVTWRPRVKDDRGQNGEWLVGMPGMSMLARSFADGMAISKGTQIAGLEHIGLYWHLRTEGNEILGPFDLLAVTIPAPQASDLLSTAGIELRPVDNVVMAPCWTLMVAFDHARWQAPTCPLFDR